MIEVASLFLHPVKGLAAHEVDRMEFTSHGPKWDREWMLVDPDGVFVTQRDDAQLARIVPEVDEANGVLRLADRFEPSTKGLEVSLSRGEGDTPGAGRSRRDVRVWFDTQPAIDEGEAAANWLTARLGRRLRLVRIAPEHARPVPAQFSSRPATTRFTDAFPLLVVSEGSLDALNAKLSEPVEMRRFRPNIVLRGAAAHAEDDWRRIRLVARSGDGVTLHFGKSCSRCQVTTIDPETAQIARGGEPLRTLATYRTLERTNPDGNVERAVFFGANYIHEGAGEIERGAAVEVLG